MQTYQRKPTLALAWRLPLQGQIADECMPPWLVDMIQAGALLIHVDNFGMRTIRPPFSENGAAAGDYVILNEDGRIEFCDPQRFENEFEAVPVVHLEAA